MKISIITAVYNNRENIEETLISVKNQSYRNIEYIVIDGASNDGTTEIIKAYNDSITILRSEPDKGIYDALNKGIEVATGDYIGFLHSDDVFATNSTIELLSNSLSTTTTDGIYGDLLYIDKYDSSKIIRSWKSKPFHIKNIYFGWMPAHPTLFLKREVYKKHGLFDTTFKISADYDFMIRILQDKSLRFEYIQQIITKMRTGGTSNRFSHLFLKSREDLRALRKNNLSILSPFVLFCKNVRKIGSWKMTD